MNLFFIGSLIPIRIVFFHDFSYSFAVHVLQLRSMESQLEEEYEDKRRVVEEKNSLEQKLQERSMQLSTTAHSGNPASLATCPCVDYS